jgi:hypothetical protein
MGKITAAVFQTFTANGRPGSQIMKYWPMYVATLRDKPKVSSKAKMALLNTEYRGDGFCVSTP